MWGSELKTQTICINGSEISVRENLWLALQHLRWTSEARVLWIDALCIHQQNVHERNHQVSQMGRIYNRARRVIVWLGPSDSGSKIFFGLLSRGGTTYVSLLRDIKITLERNLGVPIPEIHSVFSRPYWKRLWIIQEVLLARELIIQCGNDHCSSSLLSWFVGHKSHHLRNISTELDDHLPNQDFRGIVKTITALESTIPVRFIRQRLGPFGKFENDDVKSLVGFTLFQLFSDYEDAECVDQRDKIFGLYSLAPNCCKLVNTIDYSLTWGAALERLIRHQIEVHNSLPKHPRPLDLEVAHMRNFYCLASSFWYGSRALEAELRLDAFETFSKSFTHWADPGQKPRAKELEYLELNGYARGRVCFVSSPLGRDPGDFPPIPKLTSRLKLQIEYICSLCLNSEARHPYATTETDLVGTVATWLEWFDRVTFKFEKGNCSLLNLPSKDAAEDWGGNDQTALPDDSSLEANFWQLLHAAQKISSNRQVLAFEENGLIFFAPDDIEVGDLVCQFPGSDVLAVIQAKDHIPIMDRISAANIWRVINFLASPSNIAAEICGRAMKFERSGGASHTMSFQAGPTSVKKLCKASQTPNGEHNILQTNLE
ncbi:hypothetical protein L207DRAFT_632593 [Hyaloscypha variabilis F]|uniref:Heterokaryon incompatibility domain-containing protein n=1 Tax=Hyaloscypha variabilis (strain UAMH 11265 / GT02V1 / F) TaxID=1149755 RepID=A0A2J6RRH2_HYAVF|nr:hypothetical protein L207DRAFT_632593 [Hyaloscypha variabilis F]